MTHLTRQGSRLTQPGSTWFYMGPVHNQPSLWATQHDIGPGRFRSTSVWIDFGQHRPESTPLDNDPTDYARHWPDRLRTTRVDFDLGRHWLGPTPPDIVPDGHQPSPTPVDIRLERLSSTSGWADSTWHWLGLTPIHINPGRLWLTLARTDSPRHQVGPTPLNIRSRQLRSVTA